MIGLGKDTSVSKLTSLSNSSISSLEYVLCAKPGSPSSLRSERFSGTKNDPIASNPGLFHIVDQRLHDLGHVWPTSISSLDLTESHLFWAFPKPSLFFPLSTTLYTCALESGSQVIGSHVAGGWHDLASPNSSHTYERSSSAWLLRRFCKSRNSPGRGDVLAPTSTSGRNLISRWSSYRRNRNALSSHKRCNGGFKCCWTDLLCCEDLRLCHASFELTATDIGNGLPVFRDSSTSGLCCRSFLCSYLGSLPSGYLHHPALSYRHPHRISTKLACVSFDWLTWLLNLELSYLTGSLNPTRNRLDDIGSGS